MNIIERYKAVESDDVGKEYLETLSRDIHEFLASRDIRQDESFAIFSSKDSISDKVTKLISLLEDSKKLEEFKQNSRYTGISDETLQILGEWFNTGDVSKIGKDNVCKALFAILQLEDPSAAVDFIPVIENLLTK
jgi:hypothetical protein